MTTEPREGASMEPTGRELDAGRTGRETGTFSGPADVTLDLYAARAMVSQAAATVEPRTVTGIVYDQRGIGLPGLEIRVYHIAFQCAGTLLGTAVTAGDGGYEAVYAHEGIANPQV